MARNQRDLSSSDTFHVSNRGNDRQDIFTLECDWTFFEHDLEVVCARYGVRILAFAWMSNHFHMIVECDDSSVLPDAMRDFQSIYARTYNARTSRTGSLFEKPFFARPIHDVDGLLRSVRYVHLNPADIVGEARLAAYRYSSLGVYLGRRPADTWMATERVAEHLDPETYLAELRGEHPWDRLPIDELPPLRSTSIVDIIEVVSDHIERRLVARTDRTGLIAHLALTLRAASAVEIGHLLSAHPGHVRRGARSIRVRIAVEESFARLVDRLISDLP